MSKKQIQHTSNTWLSGIKLPAILIAIILMATYISYIPSLKNDFTNWDDPTYVINNLLIQKQKTDYKTLFDTKTFISCNYHPVSMATLAWDYQKSKLDAHRYHVVNLFFHLLATLLVFIFIYLLNNKRVEAAAIVALFFGIHPMHVESVAWIAERKDVMYVTFFMMGLIQYLLYLKDDKYKWLHYGLVVVWFLLSTLSKAMAVVLPLILLLIDWFKARKFNLWMIVDKIPLFAISLFFGLIAVEAQRTEAIAKFETFTLMQRFMFASYGLIMYVYKLILPINLSALYPYPFLIEGKLPLIYYASPFIVLVVVVAILLSLRKTKVLTFGIGFYFIAIAIVLQFVSVGIAIMADRYSYLSYVGLFYIAGVGFEKLYTVEALKKYKMIGLGLVILASISCIYITRERCKVWENSETLWTDVIKKYPVVGAEVAFKNRGNWYAEHQQYDKAFTDFSNYVKLKQNDAKIYCNIGNIHGLRKEWDKALQNYSLSIKIQPENNIEAYLNRAITYSMMKEHAKSLADYDIANKISPNNLGVLQNRAYTLFDYGKYSEAVVDYTSCINLKNDNPDHYFYRGLSYYKLGKLNESIADNTKAIELKPDFANAWFNRSVLYRDIKNYQLAYNDMIKAQSLGYQVPKNYVDELQSKIKP